MSSELFPLRSVVYVSAAVHPPSEAELASLLIEVRDLNLRSAITGVLLHSDGNFIQCFEGAPTEVAKTYDRIRASKRHTGIFELVDEPIAKRSFPDWQMGCARATQADMLLLSNAAWTDRVRSAAADDGLSTGMLLLINFWRRAMQARP